MPILFVMVLSPPRIGIGELGVNAEQTLQDCDEAKAAEKAADEQ
ncbi:hypothetical protein ACVW1C_000338 [Bradyrhizobium sp. USDA 4011]